MILETRSLAIRYRGSRRPALDGVSMRAGEGSLYAVLGPNGSGKSTLMKGLLGAVPAMSGMALLDDRPVEQWHRRELARAVGAVAQTETIAFPLPVRELVAMGRYPHLGPLQPESERDRKAIREALQHCNAEGLEERDVGTLSGGELQRVRIARALAQEPRALVLDEPTASLDIRHEMAILHLLRRSADRGMTVLLVTHHLNLAARFADRFLLLDEGRVAAEGSAEEVFQPDILERVYGWPLVVEADPVSGHPRVVPLTEGPRADRP